MVKYQKKERNRQFALRLRKNKNVYIIMELMYMKEFFEWLGVNEKVAKVVIYMFVIMAMIIATNMMLESVGLPYYKITYENLVTGTYAQIWSILLNCLVGLLNFYSVIFLVFSLKEFKGIFKYSILYLVLNIIVNTLLGYGVLQIYIALYITLLCYFYSGRKWKYALYGVVALIVDVVVQGLTYMYKVRFIDFSAIDGITRFILSIDYFIIIVVMILVKEIYLKRRSRLCGEAEPEAGFGSEHLTKKENLPKKSQKN